MCVRISGMRKYLSFVLGLSLLIPISRVLATSGACSDHGGVNCSAGPSPSGNAICNDGYESSTSYSSTDECQGTTTVCHYPTQPTTQSSQYVTDTAEFSTFVVKKYSDGSYAIFDDNGQYESQGNSYEFNTIKQYQQLMSELPSLEPGSPSVEATSMLIDADQHIGDSIQTSLNTFCSMETQPSTQIYDSIGLHDFITIVETPTAFCTNAYGPHTQIWQSNGTYICGCADGYKAGSNAQCILAQPVTIPTVVTYTPSVQVPVSPVSPVPAIIPTKVVTSSAVVVPKKKLTPTMVVPSQPTTVGTSTASTTSKVLMIAPRNILQRFFDFLKSL